MNRSMCVYARLVVLSILLNLVTISMHQVEHSCAVWHCWTPIVLADGGSTNGDGGGGYTGG